MYGRIRGSTPRRCSKQCNAKRVATPVVPAWVTSLRPISSMQRLQMTTSIEEATASLIRFIQENNRYPTKSDCRNNSWLYSAQTYQRLLGPRNKLTLLEDYGTSKEVVIRYCKHCNAVLDDITPSKKQNIFCGHSCAAKHSNANRPPRAKTTKRTRTVVSGAEPIVYKLKDIKNCVWCQVVLTKTQTLYCTLRCQADHRFKLSLDKWLSTGEAPSNSAIRKYITHLDGYKCSCCSLSDWNNKPITLEVEHIDGNSDDDSRENVCLICPNCHSQTDTYKGKNRGNGRHSRAQRYRDGKSY